MPALIAPDSVMHHRSFVLFWGARVAATIASQMQIVAIGWQMYQLTHSTFDLGIVGLVQFLPALFLALAVGHVADRYDRCKIAIFCLLGDSIVALTLATGSYQHWLSRESIFVLAFFVGAINAFEKPTMQALVPGLVPANILSRAVAWSASATQTAIIAGPALGGLLYIGGSDIVYGASTLLYATAFGLMLAIRLARKLPPKEPATLKSLFAGIGFIRSRRAILGAISLDLFAVLLGGATALLPVFAHDILKTGSLGLGLLRSGPAIGALSMGIFLGRRPLSGKVGKKMFAAVALFGVATIVFGLSRWLPLSLFALIILGASDMVSVVVRTSFVQLQTPDDMRGRVSAVNSVFIGTSNQLGEFESGLTASLFGTVPAVVLGGIGTLAIVCLWRKYFHDLYQIDRLAPPVSAVTAAPIIAAPSASGGA